MKTWKIVLIVLSIIVGLFLIYICEESIRLKSNDTALPLIITDKTKYCVECINIGEEIEMEYYSIGYKVKMRYYKDPKSHDDLVFIGVTGKEFMLFNKFRLWAWIS